MTVPLKSMIARLSLAEQRKVKARAAELIATERARHAEPAFHVLKDAHGQWRWQLVTASGKVLATSAENFRTKKACLNSIQRVRSAAGAQALDMEAV